MPLSDVLTLQRGHDLPTISRGVGTVPVIGSFGITGSHSVARYRGPGVAIGRSGASIGVATWCPEDYWPLNTCLFVKDCHGNCPRWIYYVLKSTDFTSFNSGSAQPSLNRNYLANIPVTLPPVEAQRAIAEVLGALDDKIEANRRKVAHLSELAAATWRAEFGPDGGNEWPLAPIGELASVMGGSTPSTAVSEFWDGNVAWATPRDLSKLPSVPLLGTERRITEQGLQKISSGLLPVGAVLLSSRAPIGYLAIAEVPLAINQGFIALVAVGRVSNLYLWQWLRAHLDDVKARANGTTFLEVNKANFRSMLVEVPPQEQMQSWTEVGRSLYRLIVTAEREAASLADVRDAILPKLLTGDLQLRDTAALAGEAL